MGSSVWQWLAAILFIYRGGIFLTRRSHTTIDTVLCTHAVCIPSHPGISMILYIIFSLNKNNLQRYIL